MAVSSPGRARSARGEGSSGGRHRPAAADPRAWAEVGEGHVVDAESAVRMRRRAERSPPPPRGEAAGTTRTAPANAARRREGAGTPAPTARSASAPTWAARGVVRRANRGWSKRASAAERRAHDEAPRDAIASGRFWRSRRIPSYARIVTADMSHFPGSASSVRRRTSRYASQLGARYSTFAGAGRSVPRNASRVRRVARTVLGRRHLRRVVDPSWPRPRDPRGACGTSLGR